MAEAEELKKEEPGQEQHQQHQQQQQQQQQQQEIGAITEAMKPWEQHSAVISIPRFDYNAPSALLRHSHSGFLITCPIKREKSATKEAISILEKYIESSDNNCSEDSASENVKKRKLCPVDGESAVSMKDEISKDESPSLGKTDNSVKQTSSLLLVKVTGSGLLLLTFPKGGCPNPVGIVSQIIQSLESGELKRPLWCNRIFPIQATCRLDEKELSSTVSKLVLQYVDDKSNILSRPLKFAVGYNRRGVDETEAKSVKNNTSDLNLCDLRDRNKCFSTVAAAVKEAVSDSVVDLKSPELCILIELLPLSAVPNGSLIAAVSVLPQDLVTTKPRLCIKALVADPKARKKAS